MIKQFETTIAAIATPIGKGAISVIRISGETSISIVASKFHGRRDLSDAKSHTAHFGRIKDATGKVLDEVVCTIFRGPKSFTGEDTVEISCHGGMHVTRRVLESILEAGARPAKPGEFTQRAFLNGRIDLSQAEAVADIIQAQSDKACKTSLDQLEGSLSKKIHFIREQLIKSIGLLELELDFVEEGIELIDKKKVHELLSNIKKEIDQLINSYKYGKVWREGIHAALIGAPNAGKSSLLNILLNEERSIVTNVPGTTRDFIEEKMTIEGILFKMTDTAGLRKSTDPIELEGVKRTWKVIKMSDIHLLVHDSTKALNEDEIEFIESCRKKNNRKKLIIINNKIDLKEKIPLQQAIIQDYPVIETSTFDNIGVEELRSVLGQIVLDSKSEELEESITITNERHYLALVKAKDGLSLSIASLTSGESEEFVIVNLRSAIDSIGEIIGSVTSEEILNSIFSKFCIGK